jgi:hypothetical protein
MMTLVEIYDHVLPCFPPELNPVVVHAKAYSASVSTALDALGQAAASYDNAGAQGRWRSSAAGATCSSLTPALAWCAGPLALIGWIEHHCSALHQFQI